MQWKKSTFERKADSGSEAVEKEAQMLEKKFDTSTLKAYINNNGWAPE